jgi:hypothetical protein
MMQLMHILFAEKHEDFYVQRFGCRIFLAQRNVGIAVEDTRS